MNKRKYNKPVEILNDKQLDRDEKIKLLKEWEYDARELAVATEENMEGSPGNLLADILRVLQLLEVEEDCGAAGKHGSG